jgi:ABC-2 type transport system permease protein
MRRALAASAFTAVVWRTLVRDRTALFFMLVLPVAVIVIIGTTFGGQGRTEIGLVSAERGPLAARVTGALRSAEGVRVRDYDDVEALRRAVRRQTVAAGVVLERGLDAELRAGRQGRLRFVTSPDSEAALTARATVQGIVDRVAAPIAAAQAQRDFDGALTLATRQAGTGVTVAVQDVGEARVRDLSRFSLTAPQNLVLFVFINAMASAVLIVAARRQGILRRALAAPVSMTVVLLGLGLGWLVLALAQSLLIVGVGALAFGVRWGDPVAAALLVLAFALVGCGAGLLVGAIGRDEDRVGALAPVIGIVLGALGGCMVPLEIFPPGMQAVAHFVPHYWAITAWQSLVFDGEGVRAILPSLLVLSGAAAVAIAAAAALLRRRLAAGGP